MYPGQPLDVMARANWRNEENYPPATMRDGASWAWEFLRRQRAYGEDYAQWHRDFANVPDRPLRNDLLINYICDPLPSQRHLTYATYELEAPTHRIRSIKDHIRVRWNLNKLVDPAQSYDEVIRAGRFTQTSEEDVLKSLFSMNTVEVISRPASNKASNYLSPVTATCGVGEVLVRLQVDGNVEEQRKSLELQLAKFFTDGDRNGNLVWPYYGKTYASGINDMGQLKTHIQIHEDYEPDTFGEEEAVVMLEFTKWNRKTLLPKTLHYVLRTLDALATWEDGKLNKHVETGDEERVAAWLSDAFNRQAPPVDGREIDVGTVRGWMVEAQMLSSGSEGYARLARADFHKK